MDWNESTYIDNIIYQPGVNRDFKTRPRVNQINLAVSDLTNSFIFYKDGLGLPTKGIKNGLENHAVFKLGNDLKLFLYEKKRFPYLSENTHQAECAMGFIISHYAESKEEVDNILRTALKAGAKRFEKTHDEPWWYAVIIEDPDGYPWEIVWEA